MIRKLFSISALLLLLTGCTHALHEYHVADTHPLKKGADYRRVSAEAEQFTIMGFVTQTDYVNVAFERLEKKCPTGSIININTRYSTSHSFFSWTNTVKMTGVCIQ